MNIKKIRDEVSKYEIFKKVGDEVSKYEKFLLSAEKNKQISTASSGTELKY